MTYILAIDQGTSSTRAMIYTRDGQLVSTSQYPITQYYPRPGWVEHDPEEIWNNTLRAMNDVCQQVPKNKIKACGITNQRETTVLWDKNTGRCLAPAIVWQDRRTEEFCSGLATYSSTIQEKTGLIPDPYFSASKLNWLLSNLPEAQQLAQSGSLAFGTIDSFLIWRLSKGKQHLTDCTNASRTMLYNINTQSWDDELLKLFSIPLSILPNVLDCDAHFGFIDSEYFGLEIPITGVAGDQHASLIGQCCFDEGMLKATFGTGAFLVLNTGSQVIRSTHKLLTTIGYKIKGQLAYSLEGSIYHAGTTIKWLRDEMKLIKTADETERMSEALSSNDGLYLISSFTGLGAPHWISTQGTLIAGISRKTTPSHFARAALEGVCYQTREVVECMREDSRVHIGLLRVDGGMTVNKWFLGFLADQCQVLIQKPKDIETTARGVAFLAGIGCGLYDSIDEIKTLWEMDYELKPKHKDPQAQEDYSGWLKALKMLHF